jgi:hypothetical protein
MIRVISVWTIVLELTAPLILFFPRVRWPFVMNAWAFHIGIYLLMLPRYFPQMAVYLLFLKIPGVVGNNKSNAAVTLLPQFSRTSTWRASAIIGLLLIVFTWTMVAAREPSPLSHIPMYGNRMTDEYIGNFKRSSLRKLKGYQLAGRQYLQDEQPWYLYVHTGRMLDVEVWNGHKWVQLGKSFIQGYVNPFRHEFIRTLEGIQHGVSCLSNPSGKRNMCRELHLEAKQFITLIHAKAFVSPLAIIGSGVRIDAGVVINGLAKLGDFINIKPNAFIGHHVQIGDFSTIQPSAAIAGGCKLGSCVTIGIGAKLINNHCCPIKINKKTL